MKILSQIRTSLRKLLIPSLIFIAALILTSFAWYKATEITYLEKKKKFNNIVVQSNIYIQAGINEYTDILYGARALFAASTKVERNEWNAYVSSLPINKRFPGMQALSFITRVPLKEKESFIKEVQNDTSLLPKGYPSFTIYPKGNRKEYHVVTYIEPFKGNEAAFGFDLSSNSSRRAGLEEARDTNAPISTAPIRLVQEKGEQMGFLVFLPVYKNGMSLETVEERREALIGFISAVFRADDLLTSLLNVFPEFKGIHLEAVDARAQKEGEENFLIFNQYVKEHFDYEFTAEHSILIGGRKWILTFHELPGFTTLIGTERHVPVAVAVVGVLFSVLLFFILYSFATTRQKAIHIAKDMTKENEIVRKELEKRAVELENTNKVMLGRESRILDLKEENIKLKENKKKTNRKKEKKDSSFYDSNI